MIVAASPRLAMVEISDSKETANIKAQRLRFRKNSDWLEAHVAEVYSRHRGKHICIAGQELFVADSAPQAVALARQAHPDDDGFLLRYIPREKLERIYAHPRTLEAMR